MKKSIFILLLFVSTVTVAQNNLQDVVYLKNGSIIHGTIVEQVQNVSITIKTFCNDDILFSTDQILKIAKEEIGNTDKKNNPLTISDFKPGEHVYYKKGSRTIDAVVKAIGVNTITINYLNFGATLEKDVSVLDLEKKQ